jgi:ubiquinone/menaquinone biosynthesis C-methylase UbiE
MTGSEPAVDRDHYYWAGYQPGFHVSDASPGTPAFFREVEEHRYSTEPAILEFARFGEQAGKDVLEAGCGIATDGLNFARAGARYTGVDLSETALEIARPRFRDAGVDGRFVHSSITALPFADASFDLVYSNGVIHHVADTQRAVDEFHRVLRPGGSAVVMLYHRNSLNYYFNIMTLRRALVATLMLPGMVPMVAKITGEPEKILQGHVELLRKHGSRYLRDTSLFLSNNTDGPGNPLSRVYTEQQGRSLFSAFSRVDAAIRFLNLRIYPGGERLGATRPARWAERAIGWHLWIRADKRR